MQKIFDDLYLIEGIGEAHVFLIETPAGFALIDSGIFKKTHLLIAQLEANHFALKDLHTILLTHCHCDHIGGVSELVRVSGAAVAAHADDIPYIKREKVIAGPYHAMMVQEQKVMSRLGCGVDRVDIALKESDVVDLLGGLQVLSVPGHTPGSIALYQPDRKIMFLGDVIRNTPRRGMQVGVPEDFNVDTAQTQVDACRLLDYPIEYALFSHGTPILGNANAVIHKALSGPRE